MKAHKTEMPAGRAAFTLVELLVVIGLMALLGTISVTGYFAAVRGMTYRAVKEDTVALIRQAMQICLIDQTPTAVLFYNRQTKVQDDSSGISSADAKASTAGAAVAIKMVGRLSFANNTILVDEFADWNQSYATSESSSDKGFRFYRMSDLDKQVEKGIDSCSSIVSTFVAEAPKSDFENEWMISYDGQVRDFCNRYNKACAKNYQRWGHKIKDANGIAWRAGDAYGVEIGSLELPHGLFYGSKEAGSAEIQHAAALTFAPCDLSSTDDYLMNVNPISIYTSSGTGGKKEEIATIAKKDLMDDAKAVD